VLWQDIADVSTS